MQEATDYAILQKEDDYIFLPDILPVESKAQDVSSANNGSAAVSTETFQLIEKSETNNFVFRIPSATSFPGNRFKVLQKFEGTVIEISSQECRAQIRDLTNPGTVEEVTFSLEEISETDRILAVPGAMFYWYIGYNDQKDGQRYRSSAIIFRRLPLWGEKDLKSAKRKAQLLTEQLRWNACENSSFQR